MLDLLLLLARLLLSHGRDYTIASAHVRRVGGGSRVLLLLVDTNATAQTLMTWMLLLLSRMVTTNAQVLVLARSSSVHGSQGMMHLLLLLSLLLLLHVIIGGLLGLRVLLLLAELSQVVLLLLLAVSLLHWRVPVADVMRWRTTRLVLLRMITRGHARSDRDTVRGLHGNTGLGLGHSWVHAAVGLRIVRGYATLLLWVLLLLGLSLGSGILLLLLLLLGLGNGGAVTALTRRHHHVLLDARVLLLHLGRVLLHRVAGHVLAVTGRGERGKREVDG